MLDNLYFYKAVITSVYDGDTITATFDLGMRIKREGLKVRLYGINAPELRGETLIEGRASRDFLRELILGKEAVIQTMKDKKGKYGRYLGKIWLEKDNQWLCVNDAMVKEGFAINKEY